MKSSVLQRILRELADELGLTYVETTRGGRHRILRFARPDGTGFKFPVPQGTVSEAGCTVDNLKKNLRHAARGDRI